MSLCQILSRIFEFDGPLAQLSLFLAWMPKYFPNASGFNKQCARLKTVYNFMEAEFKKVVQSKSRISGSPRNFAEAFYDEMEANKENTNSSFHSSCEL